MAEMKPRPCPFCGKAPEVMEDDFAGAVTGETRHSVTCTNLTCRASQTGWGTPDRAIAAWNRRAPEGAGEAEPVAWRASSNSKWPGMTWVLFSAKPEVGAHVTVEPLYPASSLSSLQSRNQELVAEVERLRRTLVSIAHTFTENSHGGMKTLPASDYQAMARRALEATTPTNGDSHGS